MSRLAYVNGRYLPQRLAAVHIEDRGYQFADGVYEVVSVFAGRRLDEAAHLQRLARSLAALEIRAPVAERALEHLVDETVRRNHVRDGTVYIQVTRGVARREHAFPVRAHPALVITARRSAWSKPDEDVAPARVVTAPDIRWQRRDIKSIGLLPNVLARQRAQAAGAREAVLIDGAHVSEGSATNVWIVDHEGRLRTHPADQRILCGVTRERVMALAQALGFEVAEIPFTPAEMRAAAEVFLTGTTSLVLPVGTIDGAPVGDGGAGPIARTLRRAYLNYALGTICA